MGRKIGCLGATNWTRGLGVLQAVLAVITIVFNAVRFPEDDKGLEVRFASLSLIIGLIVILVSAVLLVKGSYDKKNEYLQVWLIFAVVAFATSLLHIVGLLIIGGGIGILTIAFAFVAAYYAFAIWIVSIHKEEIATALKHPNDNPI